MHTYIICIDKQMNKDIASRDSHFVIDIVSQFRLRFVTDYRKTNGRGGASRKRNIFVFAYLQK